MVMLSNRPTCPRCSRPHFPGWLVREADGYIHCISCGYVQFDCGYRHTSLKVMFFAHIPDGSEEIHHSERREPAENDIVLSRIAHTLEKCCASHSEEIPACSSCKKRYDRLAVKSVVDGKLNKNDIEAAFNFVREVLDEDR